MYFIKSFSGFSKSKVSVPLIIFILKTEPYISPSSAVPGGGEGDFNHINFSLWQDQRCPRSSELPQMSGKVDNEEDIRIVNKNNFVIKTIYFLHWILGLVLRQQKCHES